MVGLLDGFRMGAGHQKDQVMIRSLELSGLPPFFRKGRGTQETLRFTHLLYNIESDKEYKWTSRGRDIKNEVKEDLEHRSFCPYGSEVYHPPGTRTCAPTWKLSEPHALEIFLESSSHGHNQSLSYCVPLPFLKNGGRPESSKLLIMTWSFW